ncbi:MAG: glycosyltransferase family 39 protein [Deltaproteobacteria bacterium]|nr:glycosyltransferase family 39 protein [Deltaproteobacteria bacterium]
MAQKTSPPEIRRSRRALLLFFLAVGITYYSALGTIPLLEPDEGRYAEIPREMLARGDFVTPHLNGVAYLEKPPLFYWGNALSLSLFGETEFGARFFTATVSIAGVLLACWMGTAIAGPRTGLFSAMVLSTSLYPYVIGRINTLDMTLAVTMIVAVFPAWLYLSGRREGRGWLLLSYAGAALAFLSKGLVGIVFPAAILLLWMILSRRHREIGKAVSLPGVALFLAIALPWVILVQRANPDFLWFFFVREHFLRFTTEVHQRYKPFWYFLPIVIGGMFPWLAFARRAGTAAWEARDRYLAPEDRLFLFCWVLFVLLFFSFSRSKLPTYMIPLFPPLSVLLGRALEMWADREDGSVRCRFPLAVAALLAAGILFFPPFTKYKVEFARWIPLSALPAALILAWGVVPLFVRRLGAERVVYISFFLLALFLTSLNRPAAAYLGSYKSVKKLSSVLGASVREGDVVAQFGAYRQGVPFYTKRRCVLVNEVGELEYGASRAADRDKWFLDDRAFAALWNSDTRVFCVFQRDKMPLIREKFPGHRLLYRSDEGILIVNRL